MTRGFLDPQINKVDMLHGISFASAGSGYDDLTANLSVRFFFYHMNNFLLACHLTSPQIFVLKCNLFL